MHKITRNSGSQFCDQDLCGRRSAASNVIYHTPERPFRKLSLNRPRFSRTPLLRDATDRRWAKLKRSARNETINPRQEIHQGALRRTTMLRKLTLALVAAASLSAMALAPTAASAHPPWGGGWGWGGGFHHHFGGFHVGYIGGGYADDGCYVVRRVPTPFGYRLRTINVCE
jgi:hypothetical protein